MCATNILNFNQRGANKRWRALLSIVERRKRKYYFSLRNFFINIPKMFACLYNSKWFITKTMIYTMIRSFADPFGTQHLEDGALARHFHLCCFPQYLFDDVLDSFLGIFVLQVCQVSSFLYPPAAAEEKTAAFGNFPIFFYSMAMIMIAIVVFFFVMFCFPFCWFWIPTNVTSTITRIFYAIKKFDARLDKLRSCAYGTVNFIRAGATSNQFSCWYIHTTH